MSLKLPVKVSANKQSLEDADGHFIVGGYDRVGAPFREIEDDISEIAHKVNTHAALLEACRFAVRCGIMSNTVVNKLNEAIILAEKSP
jgi:hypothetical protein